MQLREKKVEYFNAYGSFVDANTVRAVNKKKEEVIVQGRNFLIATGGASGLCDWSLLCSDRACTFCTFLGSARLGSARLGSARLGSARLGSMWTRS